MSLRIALACTALGLLAMAAETASAGQSERFGEYVVYYSAISTDLLTPQVARANGLTRSPHDGLLNITIQRDTGGGKPQPVTGSVRGNAVDLAGHVEPIRFREVREPGAIYYLGIFPVGHGAETLRFELTVAPQGGSARKLVFSRDYVTD